MKKRMPMDGFDVTCVIGRVTFDPDASMTPTVAAFALIGEHDAPGTYVFPHPVQGEIVVTVEYPVVTFD